MHEMHSFMISQINKDYKKETLIENYQKILIAIQPVIPHFSNECLELMNIKNDKWPNFDKNMIKDEEVNLVIQINGKKRGLIQTKMDKTEKELMKIIREDEKIMKYIEDSKIKKSIFIKNKLINLII